MRTIQARAIRTGSQPVAVGLPEKPKPGIDGITTSKASYALPAKCGGIGERADDLQLLNERAWPAVRNDDRKGVRMFRTHVNEVDVEPVDLGDELRQGIEPRLDVPPIVLSRPVPRELLNRRERARLATCR